MEMARYTFEHIETGERVEAVGHSLNAARRELARLGHDPGEHRTVRCVDNGQDQWSAEFNVPPHPDPNYWQQG
jgi:hypothetical protein